MLTKLKVKRALLSTSNKSGLVAFAKQIESLGIDIIATGGTAKLLETENISVTRISDYTGFPEILGGRVKTLHPKIYGALLSRRGIDDASLQEHQIDPIDLVIVNLYPFAETVANPDCSIESAIENIDIGGPTMLRAAAKNHQDITAVVDPADYQLVLDELKAEGNTSLATRQQLARKVFAYTATYDQAISHYLNQALAPDNKEDITEAFPQEYTAHFSKQNDLRYGENPHQKSAFYKQQPALPGSLAEAEQLQGKPLSYNNLVDSDAALACVRALDATTPACVIVKHATPCGAALGTSVLDAYQRAYATDPTSAFGGIIAFNTTLDLETTRVILDQQFVEVILAPSFDKAAITELANKTNLRVLATGSATKNTSMLLRSISGGLLLQDNDHSPITAGDLQLASKRVPTANEIADLLFAWQVVRFAKSNAIVYAKNKAALGIGTGQTSRIFSAKIAAMKAQEAGLHLQGAVMASDAFFPFADSVEFATQAGITAIIQPGGSKRDNEVIAAADNANIAMVFTGIRLFRH